MTIATTPHFTDTVRSEISKLVSVRSQRSIITGAVVLSALVSLLFCLTIPQTRSTAIVDMSARDVLGASLFGVDAAAIILIIAASMFVGSEYSSKQGLLTFTVTPARTRVLTSKLAVLALVSTGVGLVASVASAAVCQTVLAASGAQLIDFTDPSFIRLILLSALTPVFYAALSALGSYIFRSTGAGVLTGLTLMVALPAIAGFLPSAADSALTPLLPVAGLHSLSGSSVAGASDNVGPGMAVVILLVWLAAGISLASALLKRRDV